MTMLRLHINEGSTPDPGAWRSELEGSDAFREYPERDRLERALAERMGLDASQLLVTAGADDALDRCCRLAFADGGEAIVPLPGFTTLLRLIEGAGGRVVDGRASIEVGPQTRMVVITTPDNPSGETTSGARLLELADRVPFLVVDNVYAEYAPEPIPAELYRRPNVVVVRTFSKAWGLAGCRVGYAIGAPETIAALRAIGNPYPVAGPSLAAATARLESGEGALAEHVRCVRDERQRLTAWLEAAGIPCSDSEANFVWADFGARAGFVARALAGQGIRIRSFEGLSRLRISLPGDGARYRRLEEGLRSALAPSALLFDMDGVLADVEASYRQAVVETAASFGVPITREAVAESVARGGANCDWALTRRLLAERGVERSLAEIRDRFQELYEAQALWERERPLVSPEWLRALAERFPLAIVTGRPRDEAERFLDRYRLRSLFQSVVCREDGPLKPDPAPVRRALDELGCSDAWMVGDTPDDLRAALGAGIVGVGVIAPGDPAATAVPALDAAGASRVLSRTEDLEELLP